MQPSVMGDLILAVPIWRVYINQTDTGLRQKDKTKLLLNILQDGHSREEIPLPTRLPGALGDLILAVPIWRDYKNQMDTGIQKDKTKQPPNILQD